MRLASWLRPADPLSVHRQLGRVTAVSPEREPHERGTAAQEPGHGHILELGGLPAIRFSDLI
jgi:hypothetical protein